MTQRITVLRTIEETRRYLDSTRKVPRRGIVPTMGALHEGHLSLVDRACADCEVVIATIYVNPTQFAPQEDFAKYPRTLESDLAQLESRGCQAAFVPDNATMYPDGFSTGIQPPIVARELEGLFRPTHFAGVCTVVLKLFNITEATDAYFGLKDYQQFAVLRQMCLELNHPVQLHGCVTIREADGLAMSSRNRYLTPDQRTIALSISRTLKMNQTRVANGMTDPQQLESKMMQELIAAGISEVQYATIRDRWTLMPASVADASAIALIAARVGSTRLIDNMPCIAS